MQTKRSQKAGCFTAMKEHVYITGTGERVRERGGLVEVGLNPEAQVALGDLLHFQSLKVGDRVKEGDRLFVVEGSLTAAEFYSPVDGYIDSVTGDPKISDWLVALKP
ncbi:glycine cleavage system H lipoate-binding protein [Roseovarius sp. MBR-154]|jgi:glycine cleavage system H protein